MIIAHCVWLYHKFTLSFRDIQALMFERGVIVSHEALRQWCKKFGPAVLRMRTTSDVGVPGLGTNGTSTR